MLKEQRRELSKSNTFQEKLQNLLHFNQRIEHGGLLEITNQKLK